MDFNQIQELIRLVSKQKISEFIYKDGDTKLVIRQGQAETNQVPSTVILPAAPQMVAAPAPIAADQ